MIRGRWLLLSIALHATFVLLIVFGIQLGDRRIVPPPVIAAQLIERNAAPKPDPRAEEQRRREEEREREEQRREQERKAQDERQAQEQTEQAEEQRVAQAQAAEQAAESERERIALERRQEDERKEAERKESERKESERKEAERKAAEAREKEEKRRKEEADRKKREDDRRKAEMDYFRKQMEAEESERAMSSAQAEWIARIIDKVSGNWSRPPGFDQDFLCQVEVTLLPDGTVVEARVAQSCGNPLLDASVVSAFRKSSPLPLPTDMSAFDRNLRTWFKP